VTGFVPSTSLFIIVQLVHTLLHRELSISPLSSPPQIGSHGSHINAALPSAQDTAGDEETFVSCPGRGGCAGLVQRRRTPADAGAWVSSCSALGLLRQDGLLIAFPRDALVY